MNTIILKFHHPLSATDESNRIWQSQKRRNKSPFELNNYQRKWMFPMWVRLNEPAGSMGTEEQILLSTRIDRILKMTGFYPNEILGMEQLIFRMLKGIFFFFLPIISGFRIAFNLFWRITCNERHSIKRIVSIGSIKNQKI